MHNHASAPAPAPGVNLNDNVIVGNQISGNAADTEDAATPGTTGANIFSTAPITGTVVAENEFDNEAIDVAFNAPAGQVNVHFNDFSRGIGVDNLGAGTVDATDNWWHCRAGAGSGSCASALGTGVSWMPWLTLLLVIKQREPEENTDAPVGRLGRWCVWAREAKVRRSAIKKLTVP
jgi:hypothetical protein